MMIEHYSSGRKWSYISNAWILESGWNDKEEIAYLKNRAISAESKLAEIEKPHRITEQDAREIAQRAIASMNGTMKDALYHAEKFIAEPETKSLIAKLNEHREPDYKALCSELANTAKEFMDYVNETVHLDDTRKLSALYEAIDKASAYTNWGEQLK